MATAIEERLEALEQEVGRVNEELRLQQLQFSEFTREERDFHKTILSNMEALADWFRPGALLKKLEDLISRVQHLELR